MSDVLGKLLSYPGAHVFGGALRDGLLGLEHRDIDLFWSISEEIIDEMKQGAYINRREFHRACQIKKNSLKVIAKEIVLMLLEECNCQVVTFERVYIMGSYGFSLSEMGYRIYYDGQKIDLVTLGINTSKLMDFDINSLYWDGELKTLVANKSVDQILFNISRRALERNYRPCFCLDDTILADKKFLLREQKMKEYGFSSEGSEPVTLHTLSATSYIPKINLLPLLPQGYYLTGVAALLYYKEKLICRHVTVLGDDIEDLQASLPFSTERKNDVLTYPGGSITLVSEMQMITLNSDGEICYVSDEVKEDVQLGYYQLPTRSTILDTFGYVKL